MIFLSTLNHRLVLLSRSRWYILHVQGYSLDGSLTDKQVAEALAYKVLVRDALRKALVRYACIWCNANKHYCVVILPLVGW